MQPENASHVLEGKDIVVISYTRFSADLNRIRVAITMEQDERISLEEVCRWVVI